MRIFSITILVVTLLFGCVTSVPPVYETPKQIAQDEKYNIQVSVVTEADLERQSGRVSSPFVVDSSFLEPREYVVFEIIIKNKTDKAATFELPDLELHMGASFSSTKNAFQIKNYWRNNPGDIKSAERARMEDIIDKYTLPRDVLIPAGGLKRGYAVFFANVPKYGEMTLYLPLFGGEFKPDVYEFKFPFTKL